MPRLFIRLISPVDHDEGEPRLGAEWLLLEDDGSHRGHGVTDYRGLTELTDLDADWLSNPENVVVFLPTEYVLNVRVSVTASSARQIRLALPYAVEEFTAGDIDGMHLAHGSIVRSQPTVCNLVDRSMLRDWLACLAEIGLSPGYMHADAQCLPQAANTVALLFDAGEVLVATEDQLASVDRDNVTLALSALVDDDAESPITVIQINDELTALEQAELGNAKFRAEGHDGGGLTYFAQRWIAGHRGLNLLQGEFAPRSRTSGGVRHWRSVAWLAGLWAVIAVVAMAGEAWWAERQANDLQARQNELFKDVFGRAPRSAAREWRLALGDSGAGGEGFIELLNRFVVASDSSVTLRSVSYSANRGDMTLDLQLPGFDRVDALQRELKEAGNSVDIINAEESGGGVNLRLRLSGPEQSS